MAQRNAVAADGGNWASGGQYLGEVVLVDLDDLDSLFVYIDQLKEWNANQYKIITQMESDLYGDTSY